LREEEGAIRVELATHNVKAIAAFMLFTVLLSSTITFIAAGPKIGVIALLGGLMSGSMFVGMFALLNMENRNAQLPFIDCETGSLVLASGTRIPKSQIALLRLWSCKTKTTNFRVVLISVVKEDDSGRSQFALFPVIGKFRDTKIADEIADYFGAPVEVAEECISDPKVLQRIGIL